MSFLKIPSYTTELDEKYVSVITQRYAELVGFTANITVLCDGQRLREVRTGEVLEYIATAQNGWNAVEVGTQVGWVSGEYSKKAE